MNIIFISSQPYPIGMAGTKRIRLFAEYLANKNVTVNLFTISMSNYENDVSGVLNNVKYQFVRRRYHHILFGSRYLKHRIADLFDKQDANFIYVYGGLNIETKRLISYSIKLGYKIVLDLVEDYSLHNEKIRKRLALRYKLNTYLNQKMMHHVDGYIVISKYLKENLKSKNINNRKNQLIPISAGNLHFNPTKVDKRTNFRFLYTGTFGVKDGIDYMLTAYKKLYEKYKNVELYLTGKVGRISKNYKYLQEIDSTYNIKYLGTIPDNDYYNFLYNTDVLLMTRIGSKFANSGFPFKLGEYLATGKPVIATDVSDINLYLKDKEDIIMAQPSDAESLFKAMEFTYLNYDNCIEIGQNGKRTAKKYFNPKTNGKLLQDFLNALSDG